MAVELFVWNFFELKVNQIENIEAELVYIIRRETGKWPLYQNEIHFNNNFDDGKKTAEKLFELIENKI